MCLPLFASSSHYYFQLFSITRKCVASWLNSRCVINLVLLIQHNAQPNKPEERDLFLIIASLCETLKVRYECAGCSDFLLWPICLYSVYNTVKAIMGAVSHSTNKTKLLHLQPQTETGAAIWTTATQRGLCVGVCVQFCKVMGWACRVGLVAPQGWISTISYTHTYTRTHTHTRLNEVRLKPRFCCSSPPD